MAELPVTYLVVGAALLGLVTRVNIPPATWVALTLLLHASRSLPAWSGTLGLWLGIYTASIVANRGILPFSGAPYFASLAGVAATVTLPFVADRLIAARWGAWSTLMFPMALVVAEFLRSRFAPAATFGSLAYTQYGVLPLMQLAGVVGIWGITFVVAWGASTFELAWRSGFDWTLIRPIALTYLVTLSGIVLAGAARVAAAPTDRPAMRVATINRPVDLFIPGEMTRITEGGVTSADGALLDKLATLEQWLLDSSRREARAGARLIVWPEGQLLVLANNEPGFILRARQLAASEHVYLAMGMGTIHVGTPLPFENKAIVIDPTGHVVISYLKSHAVSGWEASIMRPGDGQLPVVQTPEGRMAAAICFDADFPEFIRQAGQGSADLLVLPVNDWRDIKNIHLQMHAFRAIETGVPLVRAAASGLSAAFDPWGRVLGVSDFFSPGDRTLTVQVPLGHIPTLYAKTGDLFAWLCVAGFLLSLSLQFTAWM